MNIEEVLKTVDHIAIFGAILLFLIIKFLKYLTSRERLKIKKASSVYSSIESPSPDGRRP